jgi:hypothetical protein
MWELGAIARRFGCPTKLDDCSLFLDVMHITGAGLDSF